MKMCDKYSPAVHLLTMIIIYIVSSDYGQICIEERRWPKLVQAWLLLVLQTEIYVQNITPLYGYAQWRDTC